MKELTARCNRLMVEGFAKDKELAAAKEGLAKAAMDKIQHTSETASLKSTVTIMQTELYNARNALQVGAFPCSTWPIVCTPRHPLCCSWLLCLRAPSSIVTCQPWAHSYSSLVWPRVVQAAEQELKSVNAAFAGSRAALEVECHKRNELEEQLGTLTRLQGNNSNMTGHQVWHVWAVGTCANCT